MKFIIQRTDDGSDWRLDAILDQPGESVPVAGEVVLMLVDIARGVLIKSTQQKIQPATVKLEIPR